MSCIICPCISSGSYENNPVIMVDSICTRHIAKCGCIFNICYPAQESHLFQDESLAIEIYECSLGITALARYLNEFSVSDDPAIVQWRNTLAEHNHCQCKFCLLS